MKIITKREEELLFYKLKREAKEEADTESMLYLRKVLYELLDKIYRTKNKYEEKILIHSIKKTNDLFEIKYKIEDDVMKEINKEINDILKKELEKLKDNQ